MNFVVAPIVCHQQSPRQRLTHEHCYSAVDKREVYFSGFATLRDLSNKITRVTTLHCILGVQIRSRCSRIACLLRSQYEVGKWIRVPREMKYGNGSEFDYIMC